MALGAYGREGGMERFNRRFLRSSADLISDTRLDAATAIVLWDRAEDSDKAPDPVELLGCNDNKWKTLWSFLRTLIRSHPTIIVYGHVLLVPLAPLAKLLRPRSNQVLLAHGYEVWDRPGPLSRWLVRTFIDVVGAVSDYTADRMALAYGLPKDRFVKLINAVDTDDFQAPAEADLPGSFNLLTVARLHPRDREKHVDAVISALPMVLEGHPRTHLFVVGDGPLRTELERIAHSRGVSDHVHFLGTVDDDVRETLYAGTDLFVLPSVQEGFGIVYLEAWRHSLPVIAGNGGAAPEVVTEGVTGLVVEPEPSAVAGAISILLSDDALRQRLGAAGRQRVLMDFSHERFTAAVGDLLSKARRHR